MSVTHTITQSNSLLLLGYLGQPKKLDITFPLKAESHSFNINLLKTGLPLSDQ